MLDRNQLIQSITELLMRASDVELEIIYRIVSKYIKHQPEGLNRTAVQPFVISSAIFAKTSQSLSSSLDSIVMNRLLNPSDSSLSNGVIKSAISCALVSWTNISPSPVRNQASLTLNSRHIRFTAASLGLLFPLSQVATVFLLTFSLSANSCWVRSRLLRTCFIRSFRVDPPPFMRLV